MPHLYNLHARIVKDMVIPTQRQAILHTCSVQHIQFNKFVNKSSVALSQRHTYNPTNSSADYLHYYSTNICHYTLAEPEIFVRNRNPAIRDKHPEI